MNPISRLLLTTLLLFISSISTYVAADDSWTVERMMEVKQVGGVQVSPDAGKVAYVVRSAVMDAEKSEFSSQIYLANRDGTDEYPLTQLEHSSDGPQWSPDGEAIAFLSKRSARTQVWIIRPRGGEARPLTDAKGGVLSFRWSPDGQRLAYVATDPLPDGREKQIKAKDDARIVDQDFLRSRLWVIDVGQKSDKPEPRNLTTGELSVSSEGGPGYDWSPDGKSIVFAHVTTPVADNWTKSDLSVVDVNSARITPLAQTGRAESTPYYSPDGRWIAYVASDDPPSWAYDSAVYVVPAAGGPPRKLADSFDHRPELLGWQATGNDLLFRENRGTTTRLYRLPLEGEPQGIGHDSGVVSDASLNATRTALGFSFQTADQPIEAFSMRLDRSEPMKATQINQEASQRPVTRTEVIHWQSSDGKTIEGLLTYPAGYTPGQKYPLLVVIHGGPAGVFTQTFVGSPVTSTSGGRHATTTYPVAAFAARGFAVLRCNIRGSSGYGKAFRHANHKDWGGGDYQDLMAGVDHVIELGVADPSRMGVMGWSYGGFMTSWVLGHTRRFQAASVGAAVTDLVSFSGTADIHTFLPSYFGGEPWEQDALYREHSPISHVKGVNIPTLIQHGEEDERVPITQGYELYNALKRQACPVTMVVYPRAHHSIQEPKLLKDAMQRNLTWFDEHLLGNQHTGAR